MKKYTLKFGMHYVKNTWHVVCKKEDQLISNCIPEIFMGFIDTEPKTYIHPIKKPLWSEIEINNNNNRNINLNYKTLCKECKKKFHLTEEDINHYIVLAKLGIKI